MSDFSVVDPHIGQGAYGRVSLVQERESGKQFAMKTISKRLVKEHNLLQNLKREVGIHMRIKHPHIIRMYYYFEDEANVYMLLEHAQRGSLF